VRRRRTGRRWLVLLALAGCGAPFSEVKPSAPDRGVALVYCGSSATSAASVLKAMEPPVGQTGENGLPEQKELRVCLRLENQGDAVARLDRSEITLRCPHERDDWTQDRDDEEVIAHPGEQKELHVGFRYSPLTSGEDVALVFDGAVTIGGHAAKLPPLLLRKR
jgi:hypothetical protein